ncbi:uncharacterized protein LOC130893966 [Diorhabda carinulata]|uniref:uncharacterized protein LOC130893966 n=1 Tax=Diorhabda carinulata TaxID=1163345 RepID=UPI0025A054DB|nr:uncharacterized protein LOC130893966 [Diorhabda carinulata]
MLPGKSDSFSFHSGESVNRCSIRSTGMQNCRRKLEDNFNDKTGIQENRSVLGVLSLNDNARKTLRNGAERITKTLNIFRTSLGTFTQRFKISTKRRQILEEGPMTPNCTNTPYVKQVLGRTPTKMYSPFGIDSPYNATTYNKENLP